MVLGRVRRIEPEHEGSDHDQCPVVRCPLFIPRRHAPPLLQSVHAPLNDMPPPVCFSVKRQGTPRLLRPSRPLVAPFGNHRVDPPAAQRLPTLGGAVPLVAQHPIGSGARATASYPWHPDRIEYRLALRAVVPLPRRAAHR